MANSIKRILVPVDFSAPSRAALWRARELAATLGASVEILHVLDLPTPRHIAAEGYVPVPPEFVREMRRRAEERLEEWLATANVAADVQRSLGQGRPADEIVDCARDRSVDLIVMGTHGRGGVSHVLLGSVAEKVIRTAPCPVLTVRSATESAAA
jgi:nucleotide-binding universal stress UspA family protein